MANDTGGDSRRDATQSAPGGGFGPPLSEFGPPVGEYPESTGHRWQPEESVTAPGPTWQPVAPPPVEPAPPRAAEGASAHPVGPNAQTRAHIGSGYPVEDQSAGDDSWGGVEPMAPPTAAGESGLSWADDPIVRQLTPQSVAESLTRKNRPRRKIGKIVGAVLAGLLVVAGATVGAVLFLGGADDAADEAQAQPSLIPSRPTSASLSCPTSSHDQTVVGNGQGDRGSGSAAILGFQYAFYVTRSGEAVREFVAPDAPRIEGAEKIQQSIEKYIPEGTLHCVRIVEVGADTFHVNVAEHRPDGETKVYPQVVTVVTRDGETTVFDIRKRE